MDIFDDPAAAPIDPQQALIDWKPDEVKQLLGMLQSPQTAVRPQTPPPQAPPLPPSDSMDWRELIRQMGPAIGLLAVHGNGTTNAAALAGWEHGKNIALQEQQARKDEARQKLEKGSQLLNDVASHVSQFDNLTDYDNYIKSAEPPLVSLGIVQPGELRDRFPFDLPGAKRKEVTAQLDQLEKNGYNLDQISGGHLTLKDGTTVPIGAALQALRRRPLDASNQPIPVPTKGDTAPSTDLDRMMAAYARDIGKKVSDLTYADRLAVKRDYEGKQDKTAPVGSDFNQFLTRWAKDNGKAVDQLTSKDELDAKKAYGEATKDPELADINKNLARLRVDAAEASIKTKTEGQGDAQVIAQAIIDGTQPPDLSRMYGKSAAVRAELARNGYDLTKASLDWQATQKWLGTANGTQQTRMKQAVFTASESLDVIQSLSDQWKGGAFPPLNKANLLLAKNGAYGKDAASIATKLEGQITDVTSELGQVYMGGNSPTDHALQLAEKNLRAEWDQKVLNDMIGLARTNLQIRKNSMQLGPTSVGGYNDYAPTGGTPNTAPPASLPPAPSGRQRVRSPDGKQTGTVPVGTALPPGWTVVQ